MKTWRFRSTAHTYVIEPNPRKLPGNDFVCMPEAMQDASLQMSPVRATLVVWMWAFSNTRRHWWRHCCDVTVDVTDDVTFDVTDDVTICDVTDDVTICDVTIHVTIEYLTLWRHCWRHYCDITIVQHASHAHPHVNITVQFSHTWVNFASVQFRRNGNISIFSDILPNPQNVIRVRVYRQTYTQTHHVIAIPLTSPILNASRRQREKRIPTVM